MKVRFFEKSNKDYQYELIFYEYVLNEDTLNLVKDVSYTCIL